MADFKTAGVNVLIDFHQFHWSPYFAKVECKANVAVCNASGIPGWYYADGRFPDTKRGESDAKKAFWTSEAARSEDAYAAFAGMMAKRYADDPNVVGYEVFNEPHPGGSATPPPPPTRCCSGSPRSAGSSARSTRSGRCSSCAAAAARASAPPI